MLYRLEVDLDHLVAKRPFAVHMQVEFVQALEQVSEEEATLGEKLLRELQANVEVTDETSVTAGAFEVICQANKFDCELS